MCVINCVKFEALSRYEVHYVANLELCAG